MNYTFVRHKKCMGRMKSEEEFKNKTIIIENEEENDEIFEQEIEEDYKVDISEEKRIVNSKQYDFGVKYIVDLIKEGKIILDVPFQRNRIWQSKRSSKFIESLLLDVPIPPIYLAEDDKGKWLVIDGLQRLMSIEKYYDNIIGLIGITTLDKLEKKKYNDLPSNYKSRLDDSLLRVNVISNKSDPSIKYDIFMRLNQGAMTLNYQELRNCMYRGSFNDMLKDLCLKNKTFQQILKEKEPHKRYQDVEMILRYFAFSDNLEYVDNKYKIKNYKGKMVNFLNDYMRRKQEVSNDEIENYKSKFNETIKKVVEIFGIDHAFRDISTKNVRVYKTIADFIMLSVERMSEKSIKDIKGEMPNILKSFLKNNRALISNKTTDTSVVNDRIDKWFKEVEKYVNI